MDRVSKSIVEVIGNRDVPTTAVVGIAYSADDSVMIPMVVGNMLKVNFDMLQKFRMQFDSMLKACESALIKVQEAYEEINWPQDIMLSPKAIEALTVVWKQEYDRALKFMVGGTLKFTDD